VLVVGLALPALAQQSSPEVQGPTFPSAVELVRVDLVVTDKAGRPVSGLTQSDFALSEGGTPQQITTFESVSVADVPEEEGPPQAPFASSNVGPEPRRARTFVVVFDDIHLTPTQAHQAKGAVAEFLRKGTGAGDRVTLIASGGGAWWNARMPEGREQLMGILKRLDGRYITDSSPDRMTEFEAMRIEVYQDQDVALRVQRRFDSYGTKGREQGQNQVSREDLGKSSLTGIIDMDVRSRAAEFYRLANSRNKITLNVMARALTALAGTPGRKAMVLVSQGFVFDTELGEMKKVVEASLRSNAPIYFIDTRGLQGLPESFTAAFGPPIDSRDTIAVLADITRDAEGTESIALDSGGFVVKNSNDLAGGIQRVSSESRTYYLLGYNPSDTRRDGKFRKIEVKLLSKQRGLKIRARRGYYAAQDGAPKAPAESDPVVARALDSPFEIREVPLRVAAYSFDEALKDKINVVIATEIDVRGLHFREEEGRSKDEVAFLIEAQHRDSGEYYHFDQKIEMSLLPETRHKLEATWHTVIRDMVLPPGGYQVRVVVRDLGGGGSRVGSVTHDFEVPAATGFRLSTPILSDTVDTAGGSASPRPVILVRRSFAAQSVLYCQFGVYGAASDPTTHMPKVSSSYEIRRADGTLLKRSARTAITPTSLGALLRLQGISLPVAEPGTYELRLSVRDEVANRLLNLKEEFMIEAPATRKADQ